MLPLNEFVQKRYNKTIAECSNEELYLALLNYSKLASSQKPVNTGKKKVYYISAEFLIGKLLSNNLINLGLYDDVKKELAAAGKELIEIEEVELEPSLGNGGLGRLAACFIDSIATLGLNGDGVGLNYHFGLFQQVLKNNQQETIPNAWLTEQNWLVRSSRSYGELKDIWSKAIVLAYVAPPSKEKKQNIYEPSFGYTVRRKNGLYVDTYTEVGGKVEIVRTTDINKPYIVGKAAGYLIKGCI